MVGFTLNDRSLLNSLDKIFQQPSINVLRYNIKHNSWYCMISIWMTCSYFPTTFTILEKKKHLVHSIWKSYRFVLQLPTFRKHLIPLSPPIDTIIPIIIDIEVLHTTKNGTNYHKTVFLSKLLSGMNVNFHLFCRL